MKNKEKDFETPKDMTDEELDKEMFKDLYDTIKEGGSEDHCNGGHYLGDGVYVLPDGTLTVE